MLQSLAAVTFHTSLLSQGKFENEAKFLLF